MSNIPDFAMQVMEIARQIEAQGSVTADDWRDSVKERYYDRYIELYAQKLDLYIHGGSGMTGKGINDLLVFLDEKMHQMAQLTGMSENVFVSYATGSSNLGVIRDYFDRPIDVSRQNEVKNRDGIIHNEYHERDYWEETQSGPRPGQYSHNEILEIMKQRDNNI